MQNCSEPFDALVEHLHLHRDAYCCAVRLIGGQRAEKQTAALIGDLIDVPHLTRRLARELTALHSFLPVARLANVCLKKLVVLRLWLQTPRSLPRSACLKKTLANALPRCVRAARFPSSKARCGRPIKAASFPAPDMMATGAIQI